MAAAEEEKVFVALPAEFKAGQATLSWALGHFCGAGATIVITHVHVPPQMIPVMGGKFHASKVSPEQVSIFRWIEREKVNKLLNDYVHQCSKMKVKCEKLIFEKEDVVAGLLDLIVLHGVTKLVISAAADRKHSRKMDKPKSRAATEIMQRADPSCKIWFVCKGQLICTRDNEVEIAPIVSPVLPDSDHHPLHLSPHDDEGDFELDLGFCDDIRKACTAAEDLMKRALKESLRRQKADEELISALQKAKEYQELYLEEVRKREALEGALMKANQEIAELRQANHPFKDELQGEMAEVQEDEMAEVQEEMAETSSILERHAVGMNSSLGLGTAGHPIEPREECVQIKIDRGSCPRELQALLSESKQLTVFSPSSVIQSPYDEDCVPSYFICPILQEVMRDPHVAADGFSYEGDAIRGWLDDGRRGEAAAVSPVTGQPLAHRDLAPNLALRAGIRDCVMRRQRHHRFSS